MWDRYLDLNPIYYLFDLCTCSIMDQKHSENDLLLMNHLLINKIAKAYNGNKFHGIIAGD